MSPDEAGGLCRVPTGAAATAGSIPASAWTSAAPTSFPAPGTIARPQFALYPLGSQQGRGQRPYPPGRGLSGAPTTDFCECDLPPPRRRQGLPAARLPASPPPPPQRWQGPPARASPPRAGGRAPPLRSARRSRARRRPARRGRQPFGFRSRQLLALPTLVGHQYLHGTETGAAPPAGAGPSRPRLVTARAPREQSSGARARQAAGPVPSRAAAPAVWKCPPGGGGPNLPPAPLAPAPICLLLLTATQRTRGGTQAMTATAPPMPSRARHGRCPQSVFPPADAGPGSARTGRGRRRAAARPAPPRSDMPARAVLFEPGSRPRPRGLCGLVRYRTKTV